MVHNETKKTPTVGQAVFDRSGSLDRLKPVALLKGQRRIGVTGREKVSFSFKMFIKNPHVERLSNERTGERAADRGLRVGMGEGRRKKKKDSRAKGQKENNEKRRSQRGLISKKRKKRGSRRKNTGEHNNQISGGQITTRFEREPIGPKDATQGGDGRSHLDSGPGYAGPRPKKQDNLKNPEKTRKKKKTEMTVSKKGRPSQHVICNSKLSVRKMEGQDASVHRPIIERGKGQEYPRARGSVRKSKGEREKTLTMEGGGDSKKVIFNNITGAVRNTIAEGTGR